MFFTVYFVFAQIPSVLGAEVRRNRTERLSVAFIKAAEYLVEFQTKHLYSHQKAFNSYNEEISDYLNNNSSASGAFGKN